MRCHIMNSKREYFCATSDCMSYEWVSEGKLKARNYAGQLIFIDSEVAMRHVKAADGPKEVKSGGTHWVRPDYPDMSGAYTVPCG